MADYTRRAFLGFTAATAALAGVGASAIAFAGEGGLLRPPGGQDEGALVAACVKCDRCRSACPTNVVGVAHVEDGLLQARTPVLDFHKGYCDFCGKCQTACPTGALGSFDPQRDKLGVAVVQKDRCIAYFEGCVECENVCPALVYRSFAGGSRRGVVVVAPERYERLGRTTVEGESEMIV